MLEAEINERTGLRNSLVIHDVEFALGERRRDLVLHHLDLRAVADNFSIGRLELVLAANVDADRRKEF